MALDKLALEFLLIDSASGGLGRMADRVRQLGAEGEAAAARIDKMNQYFETGAKQMAVAAEMKSKLLDTGVGLAASLQDSLKRLEIGLDPTDERTMKQKLESFAKDAGRIAGPTKFSQAEVVGIQEQLIKAGVSESQVVGKGGVTEQVAQLATAENISAEAAAAAVLATRAVFDLEGEGLAAAIEAMGRAGGASGADVPGIAAAVMNASNAGKLSPTEVMAALGATEGSFSSGETQGTALKAFLTQAAAHNNKMRLGLYDEAGNFKGLVAAAGELRKKFGGLNDIQQGNALTKAFGDEGKAFALALMKDGDKSIESVLAKMGEARSLQQKVDIQSSGYRASNEALAGTLETAGATLFKPALDPLAEAANALNSVVGRLNDYASKDPQVAKAVSGLAIGGTAAIGGAGLLTMLQAGVNGAMGWKGMLVAASKGGLANTAMGVAQGKALETAAGVQPVFVVNMPESLGVPGSPLAAAASAGAGAAPAAAAAASTGSLWSALRSVSVQGAVAAGGLGSVALALTAAGVAGYGVGTAFNEWAIKGTSTEKTIQDWLAIAGASPLMTMVDPAMQKDSARYRDASLGLNGLNNEKFKWGTAIGNGLSEGLTLGPAASALMAAARNLQTMRTVVEVHGDGSAIGRVMTRMGI